MSSNKYREQFSRNAGKPADFDSLFKFRDDKIIAKRHIRMNSNKNRNAFMISSAAVLLAGIVFGLTYLNTSGLTTEGITELADMPETEISDNVGMANASLTDALDPFSFIKTAVSANVITYNTFHDDFFVGAADIVIDGRIVSKSVSEQDGTEMIVYEVFPVQYFYDQGIPFSKEQDKGTITVYSSQTQGALELCIGNEYIIPCDSDNLILDTGHSFCPILTDLGWVMNKAAAEAFGTGLLMNNDIPDILGESEYYIESDTKLFREKVLDYFKNSSRKYFYSPIKDEYTPETDYISSYLSVDPTETFEKAEFIVNGKEFVRNPTISGKSISQDLNIYGDVIDTFYMNNGYLALQYRELDENYNVVRYILSVTDEYGYPIEIIDDGSDNAFIGTTVEIMTE